ncbi:hypothetical protein HQ602_04930 [Rhodococcus kroppenstedtii]|uniref:hypothetical protein n=1 Tax=Rhodococcoides kroppenstedtii TaxID=293050 RepID=UPI001C9B087A|nr:hypothetical protein [Rhodococcus kroppenstedtii]MBY6435719.1 hypothetical protein [Rhodococcus kroppenstedtii]
MMVVRKVDSLEWLREREEVYRERLERASLVVEADYSLQDVNTICRSFGYVHDWHVRSGRASETGFGRFPNCLLVAMVGTAATSPEPNVFWPAFWSATVISHTSELQTRVGDLFLEALTRRRLATFSQVVKKRFVGPAAMHAAIPASGMPRVVDLVLARRRQDPGLNGPRLLAWILGHSSRMGLVDTTSARFLVHGGELAVDVLDRIIEVVVHVRDVPTSVEDGSLTTETTGLPAVMLESLVRTMRDRLDEVVVQPRAVSRAEMQDDCAIALDIAAGAIVVRLPSVSAEHGSVVWTVSSDGTSEDVRSRSDWVGAAARTAQTSARLPRPVRSVGIRLDGTSYLDLSLVDPSDPLLIFDLDGRLQPTTLPVPRGEVWIVRPDTHDLGSVGGAPIRVIGDLGPPAGWPGWRIEQIDLTDQSAIQLVQGGRTGRPHLIRSGGIPSILSGPSSTTVRTARGLAVTASRPVITLPPAAEADQWRVEVTHTLAGRRSTVGYPLRECDVLGDGYDALSGFLSPLLGDYFISIRGAFGKKTQKLVTIVEDLDGSVQPALRLPVAGGVEPSQVQLRAHSGILLSASSLSFGSSELQKSLSCVLEGDAAQLIVSPPHVRIRVDFGPDASSWLSSAAVIHPEALEGRAHLHVQLPGTAGNYRLEFTSASGADRQSLERIAKQGESSQVFDLSRFADTARRARAGRFALVGAGREIVVAVLRPQRFATGAIATEKGVQLEDFRPADNVTAAVYLSTAPWLPPAELPVSPAGVIALQQELLDAGPIRIELGVVDPWVPVAWPAWPGQHAVVCEFPGHYRGAPDGAEPLSRLLAGLDPEPGAAIGHLPSVWATYTLLDDLRLTGSLNATVRIALDDAVHRDPSSALVALAHTAKDRLGVVDSLIRSHLVERRYESVSDEDLAQLWPSSPVAGALVATYRWSSAADDSADESLRSATALHGGADLVEILSSGRDPHREVGTFAGVELLDAMPVHQLNEMWLAVQVVPEGLLHSDSRLAAAKQLFDERKAHALKPFLPLVEQDLPRSRKVLRELAPPAVLAQLDARLQRTPRAIWGLLPAASFAWAALARLRAQNSAIVPRMSPPRRAAWRALARLAPDYVGMDLVLADALIHSNGRDNRTKDAL